MTEVRTFLRSADYRPVTSNDGSAVTVAPADDGGWLYITRTAGSAVTIPLGLPQGFRCRVVVKGTVTGAVTLALASGVTGYSPTAGGVAPWSLSAGAIVEIAVMDTNVVVVWSGEGSAGGAAQNLTRVTNTPAGSVALASYGTDAASTAGTIYFSDGMLHAPMVSTGAAVLNGSVVGTDDVIYALFDAAGTVLRTTALAGTLSAVADVYQPIAWTSPITLSPGRYWVGFQVEGTTAAHQTIPTLTYQNSTGSVAGAFGTIPAITPTTSTTAGVGPFWQLYT